MAETDCELWVNSDKGMLVGIARAYKKFGGKKLVVLYPDKGEPWPKEHAKPYIKHCDELRKELNWFWSNYNITVLPDIVVCVGLSAGTLSELGYIKWNYQLNVGKMRTLLAIKELLRGGKLPEEIEVDIKGMTTYLDKTKQLKGFLRRFR